MIRHLEDRLPEYDSRPVGVRRAVAACLATSYLEAHVLVPEQCVPDVLDLPDDSVSVSETLWKNEHTPTLKHFERSSNHVPIQ